MSDLGWLELHFDGMVGDDPGFDEVEWAIKEIGRLQARVGELEPTNTSAFCVKHNQMFLPANKSSKWHICPFCSIEMLKKEIERLQRECSAWTSLAGRRQDRIKELGDKLTACEMHSRELEVSGSKAMDKVEKLEEENNMLYSTCRGLERELDGMYEDLAGEDI